MKWDWKEFRTTLWTLFVMAIPLMKLLGVGLPATWSWWGILSPVWGSWVLILGFLAFRKLKDRPAHPRDTYGQQTDFVALKVHKDFQAGKISAEEYRTANLDPVTTLVPPKPQLPPRIWREGRGWLNNKE